MTAARFQRVGTPSRVAAVLALAAALGWAGHASARTGAQAGAADEGPAEREPVAVVRSPGSERLGLGQAQIDEVALPATDMLLATQRPDGTFLDPLRGPVGGSGLARIVWVALRQASRLSGAEAALRVHAAELSLRRGTELNQVLPKWVLALVFSDHLQSLLLDPAALEREEADLGRLEASGTADPCFQTPGCFNNYVLTGRLLNLELAHAGLHATGRTARLANPNLVADTLRWFAHSLPRFAGAPSHVSIPGDGVRVGAALSDPATYPLAYQALCAAELTRAVYLAGSRAPRAMLRLELAALWDLVGMTAPNGEISWWGRGQDIVWTMAASFYAAMQGSVLARQLQPDLAARLRRLAQIDLAALRARLGAPGLRARPIPGVRGAAGIDTYYGPVGTSALALVWLELAREMAPQVAGPVASLPAERSGGWSADPRGAGVFALRRGNVWLAVSDRRVDSDARTGWGLLRALRRTVSGAWQALLPDRPLLPGYRPEPAAGPLLLGRGGATLEPLTVRGGVDSKRIELEGTWGAGRQAPRGRWTWQPEDGGVLMTSTCPLGRRLRFVEWLPAGGRLVRGQNGLARGRFSVAFSQPISVSPLPGRYASARERALRAYGVTVACTADELRVTWSGSEPAPA